MATLKIDPSTIAQRSDMPHGVYHLSENPNLFEIARNNNFEFIVEFNKDGNGRPLLKAGMAGDETDAYIENGQELLRLSVNQSSIPHFTQRPIQVKRGNNTLNYAGVPEFANHTIQVIDFIGADAKEILMAWQNLSYNIDTEKVGLIKDYKKDCWLFEYSPDYQLVRKWKLFGCWISEIRESDFSADSNDKRQITVTIIYDKAKIDRTDEI